MTSVIEAIKAKVDVVDEIGLVVPLQKAGKSLKGSCPFHNERTPSFYVHPESQSWYCFGCKAGGDVFSFVQKQQGLEFREALLYLAEKAGVSVEDEGERDPERAREVSAARERVRKLNEDALLWFHQMLLRSREADGARSYVRERGISTDTVISFALGYAPESWDGLTSYLLRQGYSKRELVSGGLARARDFGGEPEIHNDAGEALEDAEGDVQGGVYDYFRNRLIFPIRDIRGRVIGFGGRALGDSKPKYLNSPQTLLFQKNSVLYAIDMAKDAIKQAGQVVIVEGYVDAVIAHQYGTKQTVACIGSAITEKHIQQVKKLTRQVTLALDPDTAGSIATEHGIEEALKGFDRTVVPVPLSANQAETHKGGKWQKAGKQVARGIIRLEEQVDAEINVLQLPDGEDPDELIRRDYPTWLYAVSHPLPLIDYYFVSKTADLNLREPGGKSEAAKRLLPVIGILSDRIKRDAYIRKLAMMISSDERSLHMELQRVLRGQESTGVTAAFSAPMPARNPRNGEEGRSAEGAGSRVSEIRGGTPNSTKVPFSGIDRGRGDKLEWEDYLIGLLLLNPDLSSHVYGIINDDDFVGTDTRELYRILNSEQQRGASPSQQPIEQLVPSALLTTVARAQKSIESRAPLDGAGQVKAAVQCATRLKRMRLVQLNTELLYILREAIDSGDTVTVQQLQQQLLEIHRQLRTIYAATHIQG